MTPEQLDEIKKERDEARAEVDRLREVVRQVHTLAEEATTPRAMRDWKFDKISNAFRKIHELTAEAVDHGNG